MYPSIMSGSTVAGTVEICGKTGGQPFSVVERPNTLGECPGGTTPCNPDASATSMVCYAENVHEANCPITEILFVETDKLSDYADYS